MNFNHKISNYLLIFLLVFDVLLILLHVVILLLFHDAWTYEEQKPFLVHIDGGYPEYFQYFKYLIVIMLIIYIYLVKNKNYINWLFLFILLLLDDSLQFHERFSVWAVEMFNFKPILGLRALDIGELTYSAIMGVILLFAMTISYYKGNEDFKKTNIDLGLLFAIFLFFGIVVDMLGILFDYGYLGHFFALLEDGGEMIVLSVIVWYFAHLSLRSENNKTYLFQYILKSRSEFNLK